MASIDINRSTTGVALPTAVSSEIWAKTIENSAIMQLARKVSIPGTGQTIQVITGDAQASWVNETAKIPASEAAFQSKPMKPYKLAVIEPVSREFTRDAKALYAELLRRLPLSLGKKFDSTVFGTTAPGSGFDVLGDAQASAIGGDAWGGLVTADSLIADNDGILNGWAIAPQAKKILLTAVDGNKRPLFVSNPQTEGGVPQLMGQATYMTKGAYTAGTPATVGFAGAWTDAVYGMVEGIQMMIADQATVGDINLFEQDMVAIRVLMEVGFVVRDKTEFVRLTDAAAQG